MAAENGPPQPFHQSLHKVNKTDPALTPSWRRQAADKINHVYSTSDSNRRCEGKQSKEVEVPRGRVGIAVVDGIGLSLTDLVTEKEVRANAYQTGSSMCKGPVGGLCLVW